MKKKKHKLKKYVRKAKKAVSFLKKISGSFSNIWKILLVVFQLRLLLFVATVGMSFFGWSSLQDAKFWKGEANRISLKSEDRARLFVFRNRIISKSILGDGKFDITSHYIPYEGPAAEIIIPKGDNEKLRIKVRKLGLTLTPGIGYLYAHDRLQPSIDLKFLYLYRWGVNAGIATRGPTIGLSRHLDDMPRRLGVPWLKLNNLELQGGWQPVTWHEMTTGEKPPGNRVFGGIRVNF